MSKRYKKQKSVMTHQFSQVPKAEIQRSSFDRSSGLKTTFNASDGLIPVFCDEVLPGDSFSLKMSAFARLATPIHPIMDNLHFQSFFFFVPTRLVWENWQKFNGEQQSPGDPTDFVVPTLGQGEATVNFGEGSIYDYFGLPTKVDLPGGTISELPFRAYNLIWNEWFRDQNLQNSKQVELGNSSQAEPFAIQKRGKRHDYFTSCLPWPQKGDPVSIPIAGDAPVYGIGVRTNAATNLTQSVNETGNPNNPVTYNATAAGSIESATPQSDFFINTLGGATNGEPQIFADLASASTITINELREAFQIQRLLERDARGGTRYIEIIKSHFGVSSPDARLQRPEYLGGGSTPINISPVASTVPTDISATPQGNLAAVGTMSAHGHGFSKSFTEHGFIINLINVRADLTYQQGLERMWSRQTRYDYYWPALAHLGEQAVLSKEIYVDGTAADEDVFGYQERYAEYRYKPSKITGLFRSNADQSLDVWHLSQDFADRPTLSAAFIIDQPPIDRVVAVPSEPDFIMDTYFKLRCARPMPLYGVPGLIDHF